MYIDTYIYIYTYIYIHRYDVNVYSVMILVIVLRFPFPARIKHSRQSMVDVGGKKYVGPWYGGVTRMNGGLVCSLLLGIHLLGWFTTIYDCLKRSRNGDGLWMASHGSSLKPWRSELSRLPSPPAMIRWGTILVADYHNCSRVQHWVKQGLFKFIRLPSVFPNHDMHIF